MTDVLVMRGSKHSCTRSRSRATAGSLMVLGVMLTMPPLCRSEPVEIKQESFTGSGYTFRRGAACLVVTAEHVVREPGVTITVQDRSSPRVGAERTYRNEGADLALLTLPEGTPVACTTTWPDSAWLRAASFGVKSEFRAIRHYPGGREEIVFMKYAGGDKSHLFLAQADGQSIVESDSGSIVDLDGKLVGIVQSVATGNRRVKVLRFDKIDELVGDRFRAAAGTRFVTFSGVLQNGGSQPDLVDVSAVVSGGKNRADGDADPHLH